MGGTYEIFEKSPDGRLVFVEQIESLEQAKVRFFSLTQSSRREYLIWDPARGREVVLRAAAAA
jgi:hypothetical protein